jgi:hypothetical protein
MDHDQIARSFRADESCELSDFFGLKIWNLNFDIKPS